MTLRITDTFAVRRIGTVAVATIIEDFPASVTLDATQVRAAAEAFNLIAVMLEVGGDDSAADIYPDDAESAGDKAYQLAKEAA